MMRWAGRALVFALFLALMLAVLGTMLKGSWRAGFVEIERAAKERFQRLTSQTPHHQNQR